MTRTPSQALLPWQQAGSIYSEARRKALSYAILAPNPHNRQPWLVDLSEPDTVRLFVDTSRLLPATDPFSRQITIGLGCFLELMQMAAAEDGYRVDIKLFPQGSDERVLDARPVAVARFISDSAITPDPLFAHVLNRRSLKEPYDTSRPVPDTVTTDLLQVTQTGVVTGVSNDRQQIEQLRQLTHEALEIEIRTPYTFKESVDLFRIGKAEIEANPDGIAFSGAFFETLHLLGLFTREITLNPASSAFQQGLDSVLANCDTAMGFVWLTTASNTREDQINVGRAWLRINLATTALGIGAQPLSQALQEYPEMSAHYRHVHTLLAANGGTVQMLARLGYGPKVAESPRWRLEEKIITV